MKTAGSYRTNSIPSKTATLVTEFAVEDMPLGRTAALVPEIAVKDLPLAEHSVDDILIFFGDIVACLSINGPTLLKQLRAAAGKN